MSSNNLNLFRILIYLMSESSHIGMASQPGVYFFPLIRFFHSSPSQTSFFLVFSASEPEQETSFTIESLILSSLFWSGPWKNLKVEKLRGNRKNIHLIWEISPTNWAFFHRYFEEIMTHTSYVTLDNNQNLMTMLLGAPSNYQ